MSDKKSDMDEVRDLWEKEQDKKEEAAINQAGEELFTGMRKPEHSTPMPKAKSVFKKPGAPEVGKFSRKLFKEGGRKKGKSRRKRRKTKRKTKKRRRRKKRKSKKRRRNQRGCKR
jgi:hypothetical protein